MAKKLMRTLCNIWRMSLELKLDLAIKRMPKGKSPGLDGLTVEFYTFFLERYQRTAL